MAILNLKNYLIVGAVALLIGVLVSGITVWNLRGTEIELLTANHDKALLESKLAATTAQRDLNQLKLNFETNLGDKSNELQTSFQNSVTAINKSVADLAKFRLQDPYANRGAGSTPATGGTSGNNGSNPGGGILSPEASQFLYAFSGESNTVLERLRTCKAWNAEVETEMEEYRQQVFNLKEDLRKRGLLKED